MSFVSSGHYGNLLLTRKLSVWHFAAIYDTVSRICQSCEQIAAKLTRHSTKVTQNKIIMAIVFEADSNIRISWAWPNDFSIKLFYQSLRKLAQIKGYSYKFGHVCLFIQLRQRSSWLVVTRHVELTYCARNLCAVANIAIISMWSKACRPARGAHQLEMGYLSQLLLLTRFGFFNFVCVYTQGKIDKHWNWPIICVFEDYSCSFRYHGVKLMNASVFPDSVPLV